MATENRGFPIIHEEFGYGSKTLSLDINPAGRSTSVRFGTRRGLLHRRKPRETTTIFSMADEKLAKAARLLGFSITLSLDTANPKLKSWLEANYMALGFDALEPNDPSAYRETAVKIYSP